MAARVIWKGSISFGLVHVPVALYSAEQRNELSLSMVDRRDGAPVGYKRINKSTGKEVPWDDVAKGYEYEKGSYVVLEEEDLQAANVKATQTVDIMGFVEGAEIPFIYYSRPYVLEPINKGEKVYALLREALRKTGKVGIAKVVLRSREHLAALVAQDDLLVLELLRFQYELREMSQFSVPKGDLSDLGVTKKELEMAERLVQDMTEDWSPEQYKDEYREDLLQMIEQKVTKGGVTNAPAAAEGPKSADVIDLMALLKRSVEKQGKNGRQATSAKSKSGKRASKKKPSAKKKSSGRSTAKKSASR